MRHTIPVPSGALFKRTDAEPNCPIKSCVILWFGSRATVTRFLIASSFPLRIASGISVAFPSPAPTCKKHKRMRNHLSGTAQKPRLAVFRSNNHMYAQIIDDTVVPVSFQIHRSHRQPYCESMFLSDRVKISFSLSRYADETIRRKVGKTGKK